MTRQDGETTLAGFLQASRARTTPEDVGVATYGDRRRVRGLRREEIAMLAGVSASYYTRLEQGQSHNASPQVLDALATALHLNSDERAHLHRLAAGSAPRTPRRRAEHADPALLELLRALGTVPGLVLGRWNDVLAWNPTGHALLASHLPVDAPASAATRPNITRMVFLDPETRALYVDWELKSRRVVGSLRLGAGLHPQDAVLSSLVGDLAVASREFATLWGDHRVEACASAVYDLRHPLVGELSVRQQTLRSVDAGDQTLVVHTADPGSPSDEALILLNQLAAR